MNDAELRAAVEARQIALIQEALDGLREQGLVEAAPDGDPTDPSWRLTFEAMAWERWKDEPPDVRAMAETLVSVVGFPIEGTHRGTTLLDVILPGRR